MRNLNDEYVVKQKIYKQQKEYRKTPEGRLALQRAKERLLLKKMKSIGDIRCTSCTESKFEVLNIYEEKILCYNCRYERVPILEEDEICQ